MQAFRRSPEFFGAAVSFAMVCALGALVIAYPSDGSPWVYPVRVGCLVALFVTHSWLLLRLLSSYRQSHFNSPPPPTPLAEDADVIPLPDKRWAR
jgi:hypothetical protein